ncbi:hypothetical protein C8D88_10842 [Lentzea atacamensis]|uniref:3-oxoacyl-ACP synthase n=2 Tax=Lentzea TaxID=165301 RepID=A0A316HVI1_9PSEU|nr:hypothetical protein C8D88_10842 [Lentzea atacamensis]
MRHPIGIIGTGSYLPDHAVSNAEVAATTGVTDEWITRKTHIRWPRLRAAEPEAW